MDLTSSIEEDLNDSEKGLEGVSLFQMGIRGAPSPSHQIDLESIFELAYQRKLDWNSIAKMKDKSHIYLAKSLTFSIGSHLDISEGG